MGNAETAARHRAACELIRTLDQHRVLAATGRDTDYDGQRLLEAHQEYRSASRRAA